MPKAGWLTGHVHQWKTWRRYDLCGRPALGTRHQHDINDGGSEFPSQPTYAPSYADYVGNSPAETYSQQLHNWQHNTSTTLTWPCSKLDIRKHSATLTCTAVNTTVWYNWHSHAAKHSVIGTGEKGKPWSAGNNTNLVEETAKLIKSVIKKNSWKLDGGYYYYVSTNMWQLQSRQVHFDPTVTVCP